jgi:RNA polymerase sigma-70 factor, ECF subfamily
VETFHLIRSCQQGDETAFRTLIRQFSGLGFRVAFRMMNDEEESRDIVQESFITVWQKIGTFDPAREFTGWFYRIVVNKCHDALRRKKRMKLVPLAADPHGVLDMPGDTDPSKGMDNREMAMLVRDLTSRLSPKQKIIFVLSELEDLSHEEIELITGMGRDTIKSNLNHARRKIGALIRNHI